MTLRALAGRTARRARLAASVLPWRLRAAKDAWGRKGFDQAALVTLDVFDTSLLRSVARPIDAFWLAAWRANQRLGWNLDVEATARARIAGEARARASAHQAGRFEVTLREIYDAAGFDPALRDGLLDEEIATERDICFANPDILALYNELVARGVRVAFLSDTYMPTDLVRDLLSAAGYAGALEVFASSTYGLSKADGNLFAVVAQETGVAAARIWHIGDNPAADVARARASGWNALWYRPNLEAGPEARGHGEARIVNSLLAGTAHSLRGTGTAAAAVWRGIGIGVAGPIFLGFAQFVAASVTQRPADRVAFCARDGRIIRAVYERLQRISAGLPPSFYLLVSRRSIVFPMIEEVGEAELDFLTAQFAPLRVREVFARIGLDAGSYEGALREAGLTQERLLDSDSAVQALRRVLASVASDIVAAAQRERALLAEYLAQEGCLSAGSLAFVDIGWQGSLQKAAAKLFARLAHPIRLEGLYFGTNDTVVAHGGPAGDMSGWFVESGQPAARYHLTRTQWAVLELLFTAEHGSVIGYRRGACGKVEAVLDESPSAALPDYERAAGALQAAALEFVDRYIAAFGGLNPAPVSAADVAPLLERLALRPTLAEARAIGDLFHVDGFGATRTGQFIARPLSLRDPRRAMRDFRQASWRRGYLVRVFGGRRAALAAIAAIELARPGFKSA